MNPFDEIDLLMTSRVMPQTKSQSYTPSASPSPTKTSLAEDPLFGITDSFTLDFNLDSPSMPSSTVMSNFESRVSVSSLDLDEDWSADVFENMEHAKSPKTTSKATKNFIKPPLVRSATKSVCRPKHNFRVARASSASFLPTHTQSKISPSSPKSMNRIEGKVLVLDYLSRGITMIKFGQKSKPHFRPFFISPDRKKFMWISKGKSTKKTEGRF